jgi:hypothetical protein
MRKNPSDRTEPWTEICDTSFRRLLELSAPELVPGIDWTRRVHFLDPKLETFNPPEMGRLHFRHLAKVFWKASRKPILIHTELVSEVEPLVETRIFLDWGSLYLNHGLDVFSLVLLADQDPGYRPWRYFWEFAGCSLDFRFRTCKFLDFETEFLEASTNPISKIVLAQRLARQTAGDPWARLEGKLRWLDRILAQGFPEHEKQTLLRALDWMNPLPSSLAMEFQRRVPLHHTHTLDHARPHTLRGERP